MALRELYEAPWPLVTTVMELRGYVAAKRALDGLTSQSTPEQRQAVQEMPFYGQVMDVQGQLFRERQAQLAQRAPRKKRESRGS